jgi:hypothetical protein
MGADIHGCWELQAPDGKWYAFRKINESRSYLWFSIMSGVRGFVEKRCGSRKWEPRWDGGSSWWMNYCGLTDGEDDLSRTGLHDFTIATCDDVKNANEMYVRLADLRGASSPITHEAIPLPENVVDSLWVGTLDEARTESRIPMRVPLWVVLGFEAQPDPNDPAFRSKLRFICAYDS